MKRIFKAMQLFTMLALLLFPTIAGAEETKQEFIGPIDFVSYTEYVEGDGWSWDPVKKELILSGVNLTGDGKYTITADSEVDWADAAVSLPGGSTVIVKKGTVNNLTGGVCGIDGTKGDLSPNEYGLTIKGGGTLNIEDDSVGLFSYGSINIEETTVNFSNSSLAVSAVALRERYIGKPFEYVGASIHIKNSNVTVNDCYGGFYTQSCDKDSNPSASGTDWPRPKSYINIVDSNIDMHVIPDTGNKCSNHCILVRDGYLNIDNSNINMNSSDEAVVVWRRYESTETKENLIRLEKTYINGAYEIAAANTFIRDDFDVRAETFVKKGESTTFSFESTYILWSHKFTNATHSIELKDTLKKCTVTFDAQGGDMVEPKYVYSTRTIGTLPITNKPNAKFLGWTTQKDSGISDVTADTIIYEDVTLYAVWVPVYTIFFDSCGGTPVNEQLFDEGNTLGKLPTPTKNGFQFIGWASTIDASTADITEQTVVTGNATYYAIWKLNITNTSSLSDGMQPWQAAQLITTTNTDKKDPACSEYHKLMLKATGKKKAIVLNWKKVSGASEYEIYGNACGKKMKKLKTLSGKAKSYTFKKLKAKKYYKYLIVAYKTVGNRKEVISISKSVHATTSGGKYGNPSKVKVVKKSVTIKKKKKLKLKPSVAGSKKVKTHIAKLRYESSNTKVATVSSKGVITGKAKGKCTIYIYAQNGVSTRIRLKVK